MQIITILMFVVGSIVLLTTNNPDILLSCGIFGIINTKKSKFDKTLFNVLGIQNDARGGDSCGIFIDGKTEYGVGTNKLYSKFFKNSRVLNETTHCKVALGHCRKASVGAINESTAQPVVIKDENGNTEFVVMHNGTIYNYKALAKKYIPDVDIVGMTDSQVMARIFYHAGYDCLSEYYGGAVFVIIDYRKGQNIYFFKGASKQYSYSQIVSEERPFNFIHSDETFIFSSLGDYLNASNPCEEIYTICSNQLIELRGDDLYIKAEYPRDTVSQVLPSTQGSEYWKTVYGYDEDDYYEWDNNNKNWTNKNKTKNTTTTDVKTDNTNKYIKVTSEGIYHIDNIPAQGHFHVDMYGRVHKEKKGDTIECWFWDGIILYGCLEYQYIKNVCDYYTMIETDIKYSCPEILNYLSPYPTKDLDYIGGENGNKWLKCSNIDDLVPFTGNLHFFLESKYNYCSEGIVTYSKWLDRKEGLSSLQTAIKNKNVNFSELYKLLYNDSGKRNK